MEAAITGRTSYFWDPARGAWVPKTIAQALADARARQGNAGPPPGAVPPAPPPVQAPLFAPEP